MNKRVLIGIGAILSASVLSVSSAFATNPLDYAKSVGQVKSSDTYNWVIDDTSDGGYVVGGQTLGCYAYTEADNGEYESILVDAQNCIDYYEENPDDVWWNDDEPLFIQICDSFHDGDPEFQPTSFDGGRGGAGDVLNYFYACAGYIAKFKVSGDMEWLTPVFDSDKPLAVGETNSEYRLVTDYGMLYSFDKTSGEEKNSLELDWNTKPQDAILNNDGTVTVYEAYGGGLVLFSNNGSRVRTIPGNTYTEDPDTGDTIETIVSNNPLGISISPNSVNTLVESENGFIMMRSSTVGSVNPPEGGSPATGTLELIEISTDLRTVNVIKSYDIENHIAVPVSVDEDGNIMTLEMILDGETQPAGAYMVTSDKNGNQIAAKDFLGIFNLTPEQLGGLTENVEPKILNNFTIVDPISKKLRRLSPQLEDLYSYDLANDEDINDIAMLMDGSLAAAGGSVNSTSNYSVTGGMNGIYLRLAASNPPNSTTNPQTDDEDIKIYAAVGAVIVLFALGLVTRNSKRRTN